MTLPIPLSVRIVTARADRHITADLRDLSFRSVVPGGFASAQLSLHRPLAFQPDDIAYYARVIVYDQRNGQVVWEGRLEDPGRSAGPDGQIWEIAAVGPSAHAHDRTVPYLMVDRDLTAYYRTRTGGVVVKSGTDRTMEYDPDDTINAIELQFPTGSSLVTGSGVRMRYSRIHECGQRIARFDFRHIEGRSHASLRVRAWMEPQASVRRDNAFSTSETTAEPKVMTTDFDVDNDILEIVIQWTGGAVTVADDLTWSSIGGLYVMAQRFDKTGTVVGASGYTTFSLLASDIVADLLGRLLNRYDGANATVETTTYPIQHFAHPDGANSAKILDDLMVLEPDFYWAAWEGNTAGLARFEWRSWPTTVRYEADVVDGYSSTGSADGLYNAVNVRRRAQRGNVGVTRFTQTVAELTAAGLTREDIVDLGDNIASPAEVTQAGQQFLAEHQVPPNAGTLKVARPIFDRDTGLAVQPWEIRPGHLIRVRGILANSNTLNATERDGVTVFRVVGVEYDTSSAEATLDLDAHPQTTSGFLADLQKDRITRRR
jgi:hypothetical protein